MKRVFFDVLDKEKEFLGGFFIFGFGGVGWRKGFRWGIGGFFMRFKLECVLFVVCWGGGCWCLVVVWGFWGVLSWVWGLGWGWMRWGCWVEFRCGLCRRYRCW